MFNSSGGIKFPNSGKLLDIFKDLDSNHNGLISREELSRAAESVEVNKKFADIMKHLRDKEIQTNRKAWLIFVPFTLDEMIKYLCEQVKKRMLSGVIDQEKNTQYRDFVENSRRVGEAFVRMFEFSVSDFKKKENTRLIEKIRTTKMVRNKTIDWIRPLQIELSSEFENNQKSHRLIQKLISDSRLKGRELAIMEMSIRGKENEEYRKSAMTIDWRWLDIRNSNDYTSSYSNNPVNLKVDKETMMQRH
jgi:hypothetical protein